MAIFIAFGVYFFENNTNKARLII